jgi:hypothetical protein
MIMNNFFDLPVLMIVFNRPDTALQVLDSIRKVKPSRLYIAADGPRPNDDQDIRECNSTRALLLKSIDWDCKVQTLFHNENLGSGVAPARAISWFFEHEEMGIILEDDCVPNESFYHYCRELLDFYKDDERVMHISGFNDQDNIKRGEASYYFSYFPCGWGWATWRRAWKHHNLKPQDIDQEFRNILVEKSFYKNEKAAESWLKLLFYNLQNAWDYQWDYAIWKNNGLCITPNTSLVQNIGFDERATHTKFMEGYSDMKLGTIDEIVHPSGYEPNKEADKYTIAKRYYAPFLQRMYGKLKKKVLVHKG